MQFVEGSGKHGMLPGFLLREVLARRWEKNEQRDLSPMINDREI